MPGQARRVRRLRELPPGLGSLTKLAYVLGRQDIEVSLEQKAWPNDLCNSSNLPPSPHSLSLADQLSYACLH